MAVDGNPRVNLEAGHHPYNGEECPRIMDVPTVSQSEMGNYERRMGDTEREIFLQVELYADEANDSPEIKRKKRMARTALTTWKETLESLQDRVQQQESEARSIQNEVYQLVSLYTVFVGVILSAVSTSARLECQHLWSPIGLSLFAYSMLVIVGCTKFKDIRGLVWSRKFDLDAILEIRRRVMHLKRKGYAEFDFDRDCPDLPWANIRGPFWRNVLALVIPLTIFTAGLVVSVIHILCWN